MVDFPAPATPVPAVEPASKPIVTRAAEAVTGAAVNGWTFAVGLLPSINAFLLQIGIPVLALLLGSLLGAGSLAGYQKLTAPKMVINAADPPKAEPIRVVLQPLDKLEARAAAIEAKLDTLILQTAPKAPVVIPKRTKSAAR